MTKSEIVELASSNTERRAEGQLNLNLMLTHAIQKFCAEKRFWWRKKTLTLSTSPMVATYDLAAIATTPAGAGVEVEEITELVWVEDAARVHSLEPIFDDLSVIELIENGTPGQPASYTIDPNSHQTLRINPPAGAYTLRMSFWAMPNPASDDVSDVVPVVPKYLHYVLADRLEMDILRRLYGPQDAKYLTAKAEYEDGVQKAMAKNSFEASKAVQFVTRESAVRSTR
jgi:hypothetical protein